MLLEPRFICKSGNVPSESLITPAALNILYETQTGSFSQNVTNAKIVSNLLANGLLQIREGGEVCNVGMVISREGGAELYALAMLYSGRIGDAVRASLPSVKRELVKIAEFSNVIFAPVSLFVLSNVLLDNWQIEAIEEKYLKQERPRRSGKHFYFAVMERELPNLAAFGIYGNSVVTLDGSQVCSYGNCADARRSISEGFLELNNPFVLSNTAYDELDSVARVVRADLLKILGTIDTELRAFHKRSQWAFVSYSEFFIWWYHFLYTQVTNELVAQGVVLIPEGGIFTYLVR